MQKRILFVDDDSNVLQGLERMLRPLRHEWSVHFATSGAEALVLLEASSFDVVVSDMRMPGIDGAELLNEVMRLYPHIVRMVLSGQASREDVMRAVGPTHQYLSKPCDAETLKAKVAHALALRSLLADDALKRLISQMKSLPSLPSLYVALMRELEAEEPSMQRVADIVERDVGMTAKILQLVNSAYFGCRSEISSAGQALWLLGIETIRTLVLSVHVFSMYENKSLKNFDLAALSRHSNASGAIARGVGRARRAPAKLCDDAFTAGLLHDAGKLVLASSLTDVYAEVVTVAAHEKTPLWRAEQDRFGCTHAGVGAYLLALWGLPDAVVEAVALHHQPASSAANEFSALTAVHVANILEHRWGGTSAPEELDETYLRRVSPDLEVAAWEQTCATVKSELGYAS